MTHTIPDVTRPSLGLLFDLRNPPAHARPWHELIGGALDTIVEAEKLGADSIWTTEHHGFDDGYLSQPLTFLAAVAARTQTVRLGTGVLLASMRHPRHVAEQAALLDQLSGGRLELGIGAGYAPNEFVTFGKDLGRRMTLADQATAAIRDDLWNGELVPPPYQDRIPMWMGYQGPQGARRAGRLGVGLLSTGRHLLGPYHEGLAEAGFNAESARMGGLVPLIVANDPERTAHALAPYYAHQLDTYAEARVRGTDKPAPGPSDHAALATQMVNPSSNGLRVVTPADAVTVLAGLANGLPIHHFYLWGSISAMPDAITQEHVELTFSAVKPGLAASLAHRA